MEITCPRCRSLHELDPPASARARGPRSLKFRCSYCGHTFVVDPAASDAERAPESPPPLEGGGAGEPIGLVQVGGKVWSVPDLAALQKWILERRMDRDALVSHHGMRWSRAGDREDLALYFAAADALSFQERNLRTELPAVQEEDVVVDAEEADPADLVVPVNTGPSVLPRADRDRLLLEFSDVRDDTQEHTVQSMGVDEIPDVPAGFGVLDGGERTERLPGAAGAGAPRPPAGITTVTPAEPDALTAVEFPPDEGTQDETIHDRPQAEPAGPALALDAAAPVRATTEGFGNTGGFFFDPPGASTAFEDASPSSSAAQRAGGDGPAFGGAAPAGQPANGPVLGSPSGAGRPGPTLERSTAGPDAFADDFEPGGKGGALKLVLLAAGALALAVGGYALFGDRGGPDATPSASTAATTPSDAGSPRGGPADGSDAASGGATAAGAAGAKPGLAADGATTAGEAGAKPALAANGGAKAGPGPASGTTAAKPGASSGSQTAAASGGAPPTAGAGAGSARATEPTSAAARTASGASRTESAASRTAATTSRTAATTSRTEGATSSKKLVSQGWSAVETGDFQRAHGLFDRALQGGSAPEALYGRGYANEKLGDKVSAADDYCRALSGAVSVDISREIEAGLRRVGRVCQGQ